MAKDEKTGSTLNVSLGNLQNLRWWQATIMIAVILVSAGFAASQGANVTVNVDLTNRVAVLEKTLQTPVNSSFYALQKEASYLIGRVGAYTTVQNGSTGTLIAFNTNATKIIDDLLTPLKAIAYVDPASGMRRLNASIRIIADITLTGRVDLTGIVGLKMSGGGQQWNHRIIIQSNLNVIFDCTDSRYLTFEDLNFYVPVGYSPSNVFLLARGTSNDSVGESLFQNCGFDSSDGDAVTWIYNYGSEVNTFIKDEFYGQHNLMVITANNINSVTSPFTTISVGGQSMLQQVFIATSFLGQTDDLIEIESAGEVSFSDSFFGGSGYALSFNWTAAATTVEGISIENSRLECLIATSTTPATGGLIQNFAIRNIYVDPGAINSEIIVLNQTNLAVAGHTISGFRLEEPGAVLYYRILEWSKLDLTIGYYPNEPYIEVSSQYIDSIIDCEHPSHITISGTAYGVSQVIGRASDGRTFEQSSSYATITSGSAGVGISYSLAFAPRASDFTLAVTSFNTNPSGFLITNINATYADVYLINGAAAGGDIHFYWKIDESYACAGATLG